MYALSDMVSLFFRKLW